MSLDDRPAAKIGHDEFVRIGPGTVAGRFIRGFWQPVHLSSDLKAGRAVPLHILGEDFTLYRGENSPSSPPSLTLPLKGAHRLCAPVIRVYRYGPQCIPA